MQKTLELIRLVTTWNGLTEDQQQVLIEAIGGTLLGPGEQAHSYRVAVAPQANTVEELADFTREVEASSDVISVKVLAVQLPVAE